MEEQEITRNVDVERKRLQEECESLKLRLDMTEKEKALPATASNVAATTRFEDSSKSEAQEQYAHFQETNQSLQLEIESLKTCIDNQTALNDDLERRLIAFQQLSQAHNMGALSADQIQTSSHFEAGGEISGDTINQGIQGLPPMSPLEIFNKHSTLQHHSPQLSPTVAHEVIASILNP